MTKKLFIKTYGCQMNVYDSERMQSLLAHHGYSSVESAADADLVLLNTCHIREKAAEKVYSELGRLRDLRAERKAETGRDMVLAVAGCVAQAEGEVMLERAPFVDVVVGPQSYHRLPELLAKRQRGKSSVIDTDFPAESKFDQLPFDPGASAISRFLTIQEGCDKFCTFCVVPYTRGAEESRPVAGLLDEARRLVDAGAREITVLGQNVNAYHGKGPRGETWNLAKLIGAIAEFEGIERIRYTTSHPRDVDSDLIAAHGEIRELMPFLHLPVQSGSNRILQAMNRGYTSEHFCEIVTALRRSRPDLALSSDFIVGFPGETEDDFEQTMELVRTVTFSQSFSFKYSPRVGTPGALMPRQINEAKKSERLTRIQSLLNEQMEDFNNAAMGSVMTVLIERTGRHFGQMVGRSPYLQSVHVADNDIAIGDFVEVKINECHPHSLTGVPVGTSAITLEKEQIA